MTANNTLNVLDNVMMVEASSKGEREGGTEKERQRETKGERGERETESVCV